MNSAGLSICMVLAAGGGLAAAAVPTTQPTGGAGGEGVAAIREAGNPSAVVQAYGAASGGASEHAGEIERAYVQRMVELGMPEMAESQAGEVVKRDGHDGLGWAVLAYMSAKRGENDQALKDAALAVRYEPDSAFVLRTAAQVTAWYDVAGGKGVSKEAQDAANLMRAQLRGNDTYVDAYQRASDVYRRQPAPGTAVSTYQYHPRQTWSPTPMTAESASAGDGGTSAGDVGAPGNVYVVPPTGETYNSYNTYYPVSTPYWGAGYEDAGWDGTLWGPGFGSVVVGGFYGGGYYNHGGRGFGGGGFHHGGMSWGRSMPMGGTQFGGGHFGMMGSGFGGGFSHGGGGMGGRGGR